MSDLKPLPDRPTLSLPPASYPQRKPMPPPQAPPAATKPEAPTKTKPPPEEQQPDALFLASAKQDQVPVRFEFFDGSALTGTVVSHGRYCVSVIVDEGQRPEIVFKSSLRRMRRVTMSELA